MPHAFDVHAIAAGVEESEVAHGEPRRVVDLQQMPVLAVIEKRGVLVVAPPHAEHRAGEFGRADAVGILRRPGRATGCGLSLDENIR